MLIRHLSQLPPSLRGGAVSIGNFDGVHLGHARIARHLRRMADECNGPAVAFTFDPHPAQLLRPDATPLPLCTGEQKAQWLHQLGVDVTIAFPTDRDFLQWDAFTFFDRILCDGLDARGIVEGPDFHFGRGREGNIDTLRHFGKARNMGVEIVPPLELDGQVVSSSRIRAALAAGRVDEAARWLDRPHRVTGIVVHGAARGRTLGFPTANVESVRTLLPCEGIYAGRAWTDGRGWPAAISLGPNPTFGEGALKVEVYLLDFDADLYDQPLAVDFLCRLRDIVRFDSVESLIVQMERDVAATRQIVAEDPSTAVR
jgi:riboflavin kinase/FMN adenylyltransferase